MSAVTGEGPCVGGGGAEPRAGSESGPYDHDQSQEVLNPVSYVTPSLLTAKTSLLSANSIYGEEISV